MSSQLWAVHAQGSDDIYPAFDKADAEKHAAELNALPMPAGIAVNAVVIPSPWKPVEHWEFLAQEEREHKEQIMALSAQPQASAAQSAPAGEREAFRSVVLAKYPNTTFQVKHDGSYLGWIDDAFWGFQAGATWQRTQSAGVQDGWHRVVSTDWLKQIHRDLDACQKLIWANLRGCDPAYCKDAQARLAEIDAMLAASPAQPAAQEAPTPETVWMRLLDVMRRDNGGHFYASTRDFAEAHDAIVELVAAGFFIEWRDELDDDYWMAAAGEQSEAAAHFPSEPYERLSDALNRVFERADEPTEPAAQDQGEVQRLREAAQKVISHVEGDLPIKGWLRDNDASRKALGDLRACLAASTGQEV